MKCVLRPFVAAVLALALPLTAAAQGAASKDIASLNTERDKISYMVGMDVGKSLAPAAPDIDLAALERGLRGAFDGGQPPLTPQEAQTTSEALNQRIANRAGQPVPGAAPGTPPPAVPKDKVGLLLGTNVGRSLAALKDDIDVAVMLQAVRTSISGGPLLMSGGDADALRAAFSQTLAKRMQDKAAAGVAAGAAFLAKNKQTKGVFTTPSGLQYQVLRPGAGKRPLPTDSVRVNYKGSLLDGTVFDSSYDRGQPAEFALNQVIAGWTEGLGLMSVGAKYRFWIPSELGYGAKGTPGIPPNSVLTFDVELLDVL